MTAPEEEPELVPVGEPAEEPILEPLPPQAEPEPLAETARELAQIEVDAPRVAILMGAESEMPVMEPAEHELTEREILSETRVMSAHDDPGVLADYAENAKLRGIRVIIASSGAWEALPGVVAGHTELPVIGVPLGGSTSGSAGLDAALSASRPGVPVAWVDVDGVRTAAVLAARILDA